LRMRLIWQTRPLHSRRAQRNAPPPLPWPYDRTRIVVDAGHARRMWRPAGEGRRETRQSPEGFMRTVICIAILSLAACGMDTRGPGDSENPIPRFLPAGAPNLDPTWDWTVSGAGHTIYYTDASGVIRNKLVQVPFYS
jgi:hypothetical protein